MKTFTFKKSTLLFTMLSTFAVLITSCKKDEEIPPIVYGDAKFTVTNAVAASGPQDFFQNTTKISTTAIAYGQTSQVLTVKAGSSDLYLKNEGTTTVTASLPVGLETDISYTTFYYASPVGKGLITGFANDQVAPAIAKVKVRFVNLGGLLTNPINVGIVGGSALNSNLGFGSATSYFTLDAGSAIEVAVLGTTKVTSIPTSSFVSGKIYTVWIDGTDFTANAHVIQQN
ncbi:MAG: DUF4397 domain-containing protein [Pedobacter sp.]|nr:MAG: DUF4397 domain-containing protein [Pedobacter sp.]